jgi:hypothetical protein
MIDSPVVNKCPISVANAVRLLYLTFGLGVVRSILEFPGFSESAPVGFIVAVWFGTAVIMLTLIRCIAMGRRWARAVVLVLFLVGFPFAIELLLASLSSNPLSGFLGIVQIAGQIAALIMLFHRSANIWFQGRQPPTSKSNTSIEF